MIGEPSFWERSADPIAVYTLVLAFATIGLWLITWGMLRTTKQSVDLGRAEFSATHRPRLHIRNIVVKPALQGPGSFPLDPFHPGHLITGQFYVSNVGSVPATVVESHCEVLWDLDQGLPMQRPYEGKDGNNPLGKPIIPNGASAVGQFSSNLPFPGLHFDTQQRSNVYVMGWVEYIDTSNVRRRTAFCRRYVERSGSRRFYPVEDPDYEHEE